MSNQNNIFQIIFTGFLLLMMLIVIGEIIFLFISGIIDSRENRKKMKILEEEIREIQNKL